MTTRSTTSHLAIGALVCLTAGACGEGGAPVEQAVLDFEDARRDFPTPVALQASLVTETCSPNPGVCHSGREYPELHTVTSLADAVGAPCNIAPPSPELGWDACERDPYWFQVGEFATPIAWTESLGPAQWTLAVAHEIPAHLLPTQPVTGDASELFQIIAPSGDVAFAPADDWTVTLTATSDPPAVTLELQAGTDVDLATVVDTVMDSVVGGDPNFNGVWGASGSERERAKMIVPGSLEMSYLWRRMLGDVPGDRMPIANGPVTNAQMLALGCWIEGLNDADVDPDALIDYEACSFAEAAVVLVDPEELDGPDTAD